MISLGEQSGFLVVLLHFFCNMCLSYHLFITVFNIYERITYKDISSL